MFFNNRCLFPKFSPPGRNDGNSDSHGLSTGTKKASIKEEADRKRISIYYSNVQRVFPDVPQAAGIRCRVPVPVESAVRKSENNKTSIDFRNNDEPVGTFTINSSSINQYGCRTK